MEQNPAAPALDERSRKRGAAQILLASGSAARQALLRSVGLEFETAIPKIDEGALLRAERAAGGAAADAAMRLSVAKGWAIAEQKARDGWSGWVISGDQVQEFAGEFLEKPANQDAAAVRLTALSGKAHWLTSGAALHHAAAGGARLVWRGAETALVTLRPFDEAAARASLAASGPAALGSATGYLYEGAGARLIARVEGDSFTILGLPLLPLLAALRRDGAIDW